MSDIFKYKRANVKKMLEYGFCCENDVYSISIPIMNKEFFVNMQLKIPDDIKISTVEALTNEPYMLHLTNETGTFVGKVREEYQNVLNDISNKCFERDVFKSQEAKNLIEYIHKKYGDELEYLWEKSPDCAIARRKDNKKWYLVIMIVKKSKFDYDSDECVEVVNFRYPAENIEKIINHKNIFGAYHMNKRHWISLLFDGSIKSDKIFELLEKSYELAKK